MANATATAAPKTKANASIKVIDGDSSKPLANAKVEITGIVTGLTDANGNWVSKKPFLPGTYDVKVFLSGFGPQPPEGLPRAEWTLIQSVQFDSATNKVPRTKVEVKLFQALPRASIKVKNAKDKSVAVQGVEVSSGSLFSEKTDAKGQALSKGVTPGTYSVTAKKPGWGPDGATKPGEVTKSFTFAAKDTPVEFEMVNIWGMVKSSKITISGKHFVEWFNQTFKPRYPERHASIVYPKGKVTPENPLGGEYAKIFPNGVSKAAFEDMFDHCDQVFAPELTVEEFVAIFLIMYNESGFKPRMEGDYLKSEFKAMKYMFSAKAKSSYNTHPNLLAGNQMTDPGEVACQILTAAGITLTDAEKVAWNSTTGGPFPITQDDPNSALFKAAKECDFYKFRGRGVIQITWRTNFINYVDPHLAAMGMPASAQMTESQLEHAIADNADVYRPMVGSFLKGCPPWRGVNSHNWWAFGKAVSGGAAYADIYEYRCKELIGALQKEEVILE